MGVKNSSPCMGCHDRYPGCHGICLYYDVWKWEQNQKKAYLFGIQKRERMLNEFYADGVSKQVKKGGGKVI